MAGMVYSYNRHSAPHITCSLLFLFTSSWFFGVFTASIVSPTYLDEISNYWINGSIAIGGLLSLHLWLMNANMYNSKKGRYLKLLFVPGIVMLAMIPFDSWMLENYDEQTSLYTPGPGLYLLWIIDFAYLVINLILSVIEMKKGNKAAKLWFKGIMLFFVWTVVLLASGLILQNTSFSFVVYFIPHGTLFWAFSIFLSMSKYDYLSSYEKRYNILFERSPLGILIMDKEATVIEASPQIARYLGVERQELFQSSLLSFLRGINQTHFIKEHHHLFDNLIKLEDLEVSFENRLGVKITLLIDSDFIFVDGKTLQFVMIKDITEAKMKEEKVQYLAYHDVLTDLFNRAAFEKQVHSLLEKQDKFDFVLLDLNKLKQINDTYGHQAGDQAIQHFANILKEVTVDYHHAARLGGDEFVLLLGENQTEPIIEKIKDKLEIPLKLSNQIQIRIAASIGVSRYPCDGETMDQLYSIADKRMYLDKEGIIRITDN